MAKKIISIILVLSIVISFSGCGLFEPKPTPTPRPTVDPNAPTFMNGAGVFTLYDIKMEETKDGAKTVSSGGSCEYPVNIQVTLDMKDNKNNKIVFVIMDRFNPSKGVAEISYDGSKELITVDLSALGMTSFTKEGFDLREFVLSIDFAELVPPEFADMLPEGVEIEIDFEEVDMMDYLMSILYSIDTTALVMDEVSIAEIVAKNGGEFIAKEPFDITVGVYSKDNMFENMQVTYAKSGAMVANMKFTDMKFLEGSQYVPFKDFGVDVDEKDPFKLMKDAFNDLEVGEGVTIEYELNNGYRQDVDANALNIQNRLNMVKRSVTEMEVDIYQRVEGVGGYNHILNITTFDFEEWKVTLQEGIAYVVANPTVQASIKTLISYIEPFTVLSDDVSDSLMSPYQTKDIKETKDEISAVNHLVSLYGGFDIRQQSKSTEFKAHIMADKFNSVQNEILNDMRENGYDYDTSKENVNSAITRSVMTKIGDDIRKVVEGSLSDSILGDIIGGIIGTPEASESADVIFNELTLHVSSMIKSVLDGILPLPEIDEGNLTIKFDKDGLVDLHFQGDNGKSGLSKRFFHFTFVTNLAKAE